MFPATDALTTNMSKSKVKDFMSHTEGARGGLGVSVGRGVRAQTGARQFFNVFINKVVLHKFKM